jgi:hypothetical protein
MPKYRLRSFENTPPGGYPFSEYGPKLRNFPSVPVIEDQAKRVAAYRNGNGLPRASYKESLEDVDQFTAARLGNNPLFVIAVNEDVPAEFPLAGNAPGLGPPCAGCGAPVNP